MDSATAGVGVYLNNTKDVVLRWMQFSSFDNAAILGSGVVGFRLEDSVIDGDERQRGGAGRRAHRVRHACRWQRAGGHGRDTQHADQRRGGAQRRGLQPVRRPHAAGGWCACGTRCRAAVPDHEQRDDHRAGRPAPAIPRDRDRHGDGGLVPLPQQPWDRDSGDRAPQRVAQRERRSLRLRSQRSG